MPVSGVNQFHPLGRSIYSSMELLYIASLIHTVSYNFWKKEHIKVMGRSSPYQCVSVHLTVYTGNGVSPPPLRVHVRYRFNEIVLSVGAGWWFWSFG